MKKQGNISILVLFVLVASSLIGVLTMTFVNQMLYAANSISSYYTSYYLANAGLELLASEAKYR
jgi:ABC-type siderophore export system fused ATPase/permease subunit